MNYIKLIILLFGVVVLKSCSTERNIARNSNHKESYSKYLSSVINDTTFFEFPQLSVVDSSIYPVLDSVISLSEKCKYFDARTKYLYAFRFAALPENGTLKYFIDAHLSPASAIGLSLLESKITKQLNIGIFYYRHFLFVVPVGNYGAQQNMEYFPFVIQSGFNLKIRAPRFLNEKVYSSYIIFNKFADKYKIKDNEICGDQILIQ